MRLSARPPAWHLVRGARLGESPSQRPLRAAVLIAFLGICLGQFPFSSAQGLVPELTLTLEKTDLEAESPGSASVQGWLHLDGLPFIPYRVNMSAECSGWSAVCEPATLVFTGSGNQSFNVTVSVPAGEEGGETRQLNVTATVTAAGIPASNATAYAIVTVRQVFGVDLSSEVSSLETTAGSPVNWPFRLTNTGNGRDSYSVSVVDLQSYTSTGWALRFNRTIVSIDNGSQADISLNITPPASHPGGVVELRVRAYSRNANLNNRTVEDFLSLSLTVHKRPAGGGGGKPPQEPRKVPGHGAAPLLALLVVAAYAGRLRRDAKRRKGGG